MPHSLVLKRARGVAGKAASSYLSLKRRVQQVLIQGQRKIEREKLRTYWETGRLIQTHLLQNKSRAGYGHEVIERLSEDLEISARVLWRTVQFYQQFKILSAPTELSWAHYCELLTVKDDKERHDLALRTLKNEWTSHDLRRKVQEEFSCDSKLVGGTARVASSAPLIAKKGRSDIPGTASGRSEQ